ncbi:GNAT family N-acetyltransferase [Brevibacterium album]|uniref:GNAT family N-acetyltransferase n=1 Tax=Brevibacterium album TaxID=417948 RepID=UPI0003FBC6C5|nr:GNAT family N-acetyltransferase [Brevibacterium album]
MSPEQGGYSLAVLDSRRREERAEWEHAWCAFGGGDLFRHPAYLEQFAGPGEVARCALLTGPGTERVLHAFLHRPIEADACGNPVEPGLWDISTALLYGGPLATRDSAALLSAFWSRFRAWARETGTVSEFIRTSPVAFPAADPLLAYPGEVREQAPHIVRSLDAGSVEALMADMHPNVRRGARKARAAGLDVVADTTGERLEAFLRIYAETMDRRQAAERFRFPARAFAELNAAFPGRFAYVYAVQGARPVAVELMLMDDRTGYFFLGGTETAALPLYASVLVHCEAIALAWRRGLRSYVLTGGVTNTPEDSLLRFKRGFAPRGEASYRTGQQVFDEERYRKLLCRGSAGGPEPGPEAEGFFPAYRARSACGCGARADEREGAA